MSYQSAGSPPEVRDRAQLGLCAGLALLGVAVIVDALRLPHITTSNDPVGPRPLPLILGILLLVTAAAYVIDVRRGGTGEAEAGEDVDLGTRSDWRTILGLSVAFLVNAALIEPLGWVISGSLLFWGSAVALGARRYVRTLAIAIVLALVTFYAFAIGLGVNLPAGILQGIL